MNDLMNEKPCSPEIENELVIEVDGVKIINFPHIEELYGTDFTNELKFDFDFALESKSEWKLGVLDESEYFITLVFVKGFNSNVYEVSKKRKTIYRHFIIGKFVCEQILDMMNNF